MRIRLITAIIICTSSITLSMAQEESRVYLDGTLASTAKKTAKFYKVPEGNRGDLFIGRLYTIEGKLRSEGTYADEALKVEHGEFTFFHSNGQIESRGEYVMGNKSGVWERYTANGERLAEKIYDHKPLENIVYTMAETMPKHAHGSDREFVKYIKQQVIAPKGKRYKGDMMASFIVEKNGMLSEVKIVKGKNDEMDRKVVEAIRSTAPWSPGTDKGKPVRVQMRIPVEF